MPEMGLAQLDESTARQEIWDTVLRYCRGVDRIDLDLVRSCYAPDALDHHNSYSGSVDGFVDWLKTFLTRLAGTQHVVTNHLVEIVGDTAASETYVTARHWATNADPDLDFTAGARYLDHWRKLSGRWLIEQRWVVCDYMQVHDANGPRPFDPARGRVGQRAPKDLVYQLEPDRQ